MGGDGDRHPPSGESVVWDGTENARMIRLAVPIDFTDSLDSTDSTDSTTVDYLIKPSARDLFRDHLRPLFIMLRTLWNF